MSEPLQSQRGLKRALGRLGRHLSWARRQGFGRVIEEDRLDPLERLRLDRRKRAWRRAHNIAPNATPVFVVGVQRSGTNMLIQGLERSPEFEVHNENDQESFDRFMLRPEADIRAIVLRSGHRYVLFKPLCDSHRVAGLLDDLKTPSRGKAIWAFRRVDGRVRSAVAKFGDANLVALRDVASGDGLDTWQAGGLSEDRLELVRSFDYDAITRESAAALFWFLRNSLYFDLGLDRREDVALASYEAMVREPEVAMQRLCAFLDHPYQPALIAHVDARSSVAKPPLDLDPRIRSLCDDLEDRLTETYGAEGGRSSRSRG
jgi:hypothetical protein